jgi:hypothetical protein
MRIADHRITAFAQQHLHQLWYAPLSHRILAFKMASPSSMRWIRRLLASASQRLKPITIAQSTLSQEDDQLAPHSYIKAIDKADRCSLVNIHMQHWLKLMLYHTFVRDRDDVPRKDLKAAQDQITNETKTLHKINGYIDEGKKINAICAGHVGFV